MTLSDNLEDDQAKLRIKLCVGIRQPISGMPKYRLLMSIFGHMPKCGHCRCQAVSKLWFETEGRDKFRLNVKNET